MLFRSAAVAPSHGASSARLGNVTRGARRGATGWAVAEAAVECGVGRDRWETDRRREFRAGRPTFGRPVLPQTDRRGQVSRRAASASPAVGYSHLHQDQQKALIEAAFGKLKGFVLSK